MAQITVEERLIALETKVDMMNSIMATKADLAALELRLIKWFIGGMSAAVGLMIAAVKLIP